MNSECDKSIERYRQFSSCRKLNSAIGKMRECRYPHLVYRHYTTLKSLLGMIEGQSLWLTVGKSSQLDDAQESKKFGSEDLWARTFISCFVHDEEESAAMWGLYCPGDEQAVCISLPNAAMKSFGNSISRLASQKSMVIVNPRRADSRERTAAVEFAEVVDIAYASIPKNTYSEAERGNFLAWDGVRTKQMPSLKVDVKDAQFTGVLKDYEWNFEHETRIVIRLDKQHSHAKQIAIPLPTEVLGEMTVTFGPWTRNQLKSEQKIEEAMRGIGIHKKIPTFRSTLSEALEKWRRPVE